jgi:nicotinamidase-related amidase
VQAGPAFKPFEGADLLLLIDLQEKLAPAIPRAGAVVGRVAGLIEKARESGLPILATEQYSRGLGRTVPDLRRRLAPGEVIEKIHFAAPREPAFLAALQALGAKHCVVAGMEAHVCVLQSVLGLLAAGFRVTLLGDAVASRDDLNRRVALARLARAGAAIAQSGDIADALSPAGAAATMGPSS